MLPMLDCFQLISPTDEASRDEAVPLETPSGLEGAAGRRGDDRLCRCPRRRRTRGKEISR